MTWMQVWCGVVCSLKAIEASWMSTFRTRVTYGGTATPSQSRHHWEESNE
ncbi:hypothetical protein KC19_10G023200 [Ceratodon purpureus]|uniref:Uncharacterized protein n=1 Tax=Ceratodon purpureus TaxID=3225 RepID=A0A8T0GIK4_CERPU|nr:hypothetical protein KC19_10G023200 [Ceratodon purpureus]